MLKGTGLTTEGLAQLQGGAHEIITEEKVCILLH